MLFNTEDITLTIGYIRYCTMRRKKKNAATFAEFSLNVLSH